MADGIDQQLALQDLAYAHGMLAALNFAAQGAQESARRIAEQQVEKALQTLKRK